MTPDQVADVGREHGRAAATVRMAADRPGRMRGCVATLTAELADLGFDPEVADDGAATTIAFTHCPFRELAELVPDVVCHLHRGIVEGMVDQFGGAEVTRFATLADRSPCEMDLVAG
jgi:predicted ArsR family transcriptional regulator